MAQLDVCHGLSAWEKGSIFASQMDNVIEIRKQRVFSLTEAKELLPLISRITQQAEHDVNVLSTQHRMTPNEDQKRLLEDRIQEHFNRWYEKVTKLGCQAKGMWLVDFDCGGGYYCWHYPEPELTFFHGYSEGFRGRVKIQ